MAFKVIGDDVILSISGEDSTYGLLQAQCTRGLSFTFQTETAEITSLNVDEISIIPTYKSATVEVNMLLVYGDANIGYNNILAWWQSKEKIFFEIEIPYTSSSCIFSGRGYITNVPIAANFNEAGSMNFNIAVTGQINIDYI
jgi:predicted secreted protein